MTRSDCQGRANGAAAPLGDLAFMLACYDVYSAPPPGGCPETPWRGPADVRARGRRDMTEPVSEIAFTPAVKAWQARLGSRAGYARSAEKHLAGANKLQRHLIMLIFQTRIDL